MLCDLFVHFSVIFCSMRIQLSFVGLILEVCFSNQAVGWPPVPAYRMNSLSNQVKVPSEQNIVGSSNANKSFVKSNNMGGTIKNNKIQEKGGHGLSKFVKVNMDGMQIGRKVDLNAHVCYETLAQALEDMFHRPTSMNTANSEFSHPSVDWLYFSRPNACIADDIQINRYR